MDFLPTVDGLKPAPPKKPWLKPLLVGIPGFLRCEMDFAVHGMPWSPEATRLQAHA